MLPPGAELLGEAPGRANLMGEHTDYADRTGLNARTWRTKASPGARALRQASAA